MSSGRSIPRSSATAFVVGPVCGGMTPFSMAVDGSGKAWVLFIDSLSIQTFDVADPGPCVDSGYVRRDPEFGLFGMSFATRSATDSCAELFVHTYDGDGPFSEGPDFGMLGAIDPVTLRLRAIGSIDYDGGELTGTGDGRLFAFAGADPVDLVEYDKSTATALEIIPLDDVRKTSASAVAFYAGDIYIFTEAPPPACDACLDATCPTEHADCLADDVCSDQLACAIDQADVTDECGGLLPAAFMSCLATCTEACLISRRARVSRVLRYDLDASGGSRSIETIVDMLPIRVVGAASSPCVPVGPI